MIEISYNFLPSFVFHLKDLLNSHWSALDMQNLHGPAMREKNRRVVLHQVMYKFEIKTLLKVNL